MSRVVITYLALVMMGIVGPSIAVLLFRGNRPRIALVSVCYAILYVWLHSKIGNRLIAHGALQGYYSYWTYITTSLVTLGSLAYVWFGLVVFWPSDRRSLGFPVKVGSAKQFLLGLLVGCAAATALAPQFWLNLNRTTLCEQLPIAIACVLSEAVVEESVFRGRLFEALAKRLKRMDKVLFLQAMIFVSIHIPNRISQAVASGDARLASSGIITIFAAGWLFGWLRYRSGNLWMPIGAHVAYNVVLVVRSLVLLEQQLDM